jgi:hypothetical protein
LRFRAPLHPEVTLGWRSILHEWAGLYGRAMTCKPWFGFRITYPGGWESYREITVIRTKKGKRSVLIR